MPAGLRLLAFLSLGHGCQAWVSSKPSSFKLPHPNIRLNICFAWAKQIDKDFSIVSLCSETGKLAILSPRRLGVQGGICDVDGG